MRVVVVVVVVEAWKGGEHGDASWAARSPNHPVSRFRNDRGSRVGRLSGPAAAMCDIFVDRMRAAEPRNERNALETERKIR